MVHPRGGVGGVVGGGGGGVWDGGSGGGGGGGSGCGGGGVKRGIEREPQVMIWVTEVTFLFMAATVSQL